MMPKEEFRQRIRAAIWNWLDRLASRIDEHYARLGIPNLRAGDNDENLKQSMKKTKEMPNDHQHNSERTR